MAYYYDSEARKELVREQLRSLPSSHMLKWVDQGQGAIIRCPWHKNGRESHPSLKIDLRGIKGSPGSWSCFTCQKHLDFKDSGGGTWNNLARELGLQLFGKNKDALETFVPSFDLMDAGVDSSLDKKDYSRFRELEAWNRNEAWRGISGRLIGAVGGKDGHDPKFRNYRDSERDRRLILPIEVNGNIMALNFCSMKNFEEEGILRYRYDGNKDISLAVFPFDFVKKMDERYVVIVEGTRDALRLISYDIPAVAILGANFTEAKRNLILTLEPKLVVVATDPDEAGNKVGAIINNMMKDVGIPSYRFVMASEYIQQSDGRMVLKKKEDPGDMSRERIEDLRNGAIEYLELH